jgi:DnaK suppressor protein
MRSKTPNFDDAFIEQQRKRLLTLHAELSHTTQAEEVEAGDIKSQSLGEAKEYEDDAQKLATLEVEGTLAVHNLERLRLVERALNKIEDGTYGFSDASGKPIARERLEAMPEAINSVQEQAALDANLQR